MLSGSFHSGTLISSLPLADAEMKQINNLVREAMGFSQERGDSISVANAPFTGTEKTDISLPAWKDPETISYAKDLVKYLLIGAIVAFLYFKVIQPSLKTMFPTPSTEEELATAAGVAGAAGHVAVIGDDDDDGSHVKIDHYAAKVQKARDIAQADSKAVANIIRDWMGANAG